MFLIRFHMLEPCVVSSAPAWAVSASACGSDLPAAHARGLESVMLGLMLLSLPWFVCAWRV